MCMSSDIYHELPLQISCCQWRVELNRPHVYTYTRLHIHTHTNLSRTSSPNIFATGPHISTDSTQQILAVPSHPSRWERVLLTYMSYGVALVSRINKIIGLFCKRALEKRRYSAKETYNLIESKRHSHSLVYIFIYRYTYTYTHIHIYIYISSKFRKKISDVAKRHLT